MKREAISKFIFLMLIFSGISFISCKKTIPSSKTNSETFVKVFTSPLNQSSTYIKQTPDGGFIIVGNENDQNTLYIMKVNESGNLLWKKTIDNIGFYNPLITTLADGSMLVSSGYYDGMFSRFDQNGNTVFQTPYPGLIYNSAPMQLKNGSFVIGSGRGNNSDTSSVVRNFNADGSYSGYFDIRDASFTDKMKILMLSVYKCDTIGTYYFSGKCYPDWNGNPRNQRQRIFIAKQSYSGNTLTQNKFVLIDSADKVHDNASLVVKETSGNQVLLLISQWDLNGIPGCKLIKADDDLNVLWETYVNVSVNGTIGYDFSECPDGGYLISGTCGINNKTNYQPYSCKIAPDGNILWSQIYSTALTGVLNYGIQLTNGNCYFTGVTNGFGQGADRDDVFMLKTDEEGKLK